jgi:ATP-binding cassette subfamily F protein uup
MALLSLNNLSFTYSNPTLLDGITLHIERGERIGLVGRNGAGKSTLMKLIAGLLKPDNGSVDLQARAVVARLDQEVPAKGTQTAFEVAAEGFGPLADAVSNYRNIGHKLHEGVELTAKETKAYEDASNALADANEWSAADRLDALLDDMQLPADVMYSSLSAGMKRRVLLAAAMIREPDVCCWTNQQTIWTSTSIIWLQGFLKRFDGTLIFVTHDRVFLQEMARPHCRSRSRPPVRLHVQLPDVSRTTSRSAAGRRSRGTGSVRQEAGRRRTLDSSGRESSPNS